MQLGQSQYLQHIAGVGDRIHTVIDMDNFTVTINNVAHSLGVGPIIDIIRLYQRFVSVGQQRKGQPIFLRKGHMRRGIVNADAKDDNIFRFVLFRGITKTTRLFGAAGGVILGVEVQDYGLRRGLFCGLTARSVYGILNLVQINLNQFRLYHITIYDKSYRTT